MSKTPNYDAKVKQILNQSKPGNKVCEIFGTEWEQTQEELDWYKHFNVPPNKFCLDATWKWLGYFDIGFQFWWNKHFDTGRPVLTFHHPGSGIRVLPDAEWHNRDFSSEAIDYNPKEPFFPQLRDLQLKVPFPATYNVTNPENSIALLSLGDRNSYFMFACESENSFYSLGAMRAEESSLVSLSDNIKKSHHISHSNNIFNCKYVSESLDCMDSAFLFDCRNLEYCFGAWNKRNKKYLWFNEQLSREQWEVSRREVDLGKQSHVKEQLERFEKFLLAQGVWPENFNNHVSDSTGDYLTGMVRCRECFDGLGTTTDSYRSGWMYKVNEKLAYVWGAINTRESYMTVTSPESNQLKFCYRLVSSDNCEYCMICVNCRDCFGCVGLKNKRFCVFNKQYSEEEYWQRVDELKTAMLDRGEYGQYIPVEFSSTYVPESGAVAYSGMTGDEMEKLGGNIFDVLSEGAINEPAGEPRNQNSVPDSVDDIDAWIGVPIFDKVSGRSFTITKAEAAHYKKLRIAPPVKHFIRRVNDVLRSGQIASLEYKNCSVCEKRVLTSKNLKYPNRKIYCKEHYLEFIEQNG